MGLLDWIKRRKKEEEKESTIIEEKPQKTETHVKIAQPKINKNINTTRLNKVSVKSVPGELTSTSSIQYQQQLKKLIQGKIADPRLERDIMQKGIKEVILKKRITDEVVLSGKSGVSALMIIGILPEYQQTINNWWQGVYIDPSSWPTQVESFRNDYNQAHGALNIIRTKNPEKGFTVNDITHNFSFK